MFIAIRELEVHPLDFKEEIGPGTLDLGADVRHVNVVKTAGRADLVEEHHGKHNVIQDVARNFDLLYRPQGSDAGHAELSVTDAEAEIGYYTGDGIELEEVLREQILLAVPLRVLCTEECKGLC